MLSAGMPPISEVSTKEEHSLEFYRVKYIEALEGRVVLHQEITSRDNEIREKDQVIRALRNRITELEEVIEGMPAGQGAPVSQPSGTKTSVSNGAKARPSGSSHKKKDSSSSSAAKTTTTQKPSPTRAAKARRASAPEKPAPEVMEESDEPVITSNSKSLNLVSLLDSKNTSPA
jgi:hypothetical protein